MTFEDKQALLDGNTDPSSNEHDSDPFESKKSAKSTYYNNLARNLVNSKDKVDKRFMKLHEMHAYPNRKTSLLDMLGFLTTLREMLPRPITSQLEIDSSQNDQEPSELSSSVNNSR